MKQNKLSVDLTEKNKETLERVNEQTKIPYGSIINGIIESFFDMPDDMYEIFRKFIITKIRNIHIMMEGAGCFEEQRLLKEKKYYTRIADYLDIDYEIIGDKKDVYSMKTIPMNNGLLICPNNWIIVNPEKAEESSYASVIECRNADKFGIPHLLIFSNYESVKDYDEMYKNEIFKMCCKVYPKFDDILKMQIKLIQNINEDEWIKAPIIGFYDVHIQENNNNTLEYELAGKAYILRSVNEKDV